MSDLPSDRLLTPQSVIAFTCVAIGGGSIAAGFMFGDPQMRGMALAGGIAAMVAVYNYYMGSSKSSGDKDARASPTPAAPAPVVAANTAAIAANTAATVADTAAVPPTAQGS